MDNKLAIESGLIKTMLDDQDNPDESIPLANIDEETLKQCFNFVEHHLNEPLGPIEKPLRSNNLADSVPEWFSKFIDVDLEKVYDIIAASNYLEIKPLIELGCAKVGSLMKGKSIPELRKMFNLVNDFTPEEEKAILEGRAHVWDSDEEEDEEIKKQQNE